MHVRPIKIYFFVIYEAAAEHSNSRQRHLLLFLLVQGVPVSLLGLQVLSLLWALKDQSSHKHLCPPVNHGNKTRQEIRCSY